MTFEEALEVLRSASTNLVMRAQALERRVREQDKQIGELEDQVFELQQQLGMRDAAE